MTWTTNTFTKAKQMFMARATKLVANYDKIPSEQYSSERCGGWLIKDQDDMFIGFVSNYGAVDVFDYTDLSKCQ